MRAKPESGRRPYQHTRHMKLQTGFLLADQTLNRLSCHREVGAGEVIFTEGAPASGLFIVLSGKIEIIRATEAGETRLDEVGAEGVFGEMGLISEEGVRSATARASEPSLLLEVRSNPIQLLSEIGEVHAALAMLKQVICVLGGWLRTQNGRAGGANEAGKFPPPEHPAAENDAAEIIRKNLPKGFLKLFPKQDQLPDGQFLCRQGEKSHGFFFVHRGSLEILKSDSPQGGEQQIGTMHAPTVAGELGYFSGQPRLVSLRASGPVAYTCFSGYDYEILEENDPEKALEVLLAAAQCVVSLVRGR